jgi:hypothetical protein
LTETFQPEKRRRSGRVAIRIPVEVQGTAQGGREFQESTHTGVIGGFGAMIQTSQALEIGSEVLITNRFSQQTARFCVVWAGEQLPDGFWEIGVEALQPLDDFWGVRFPSKPDVH